MAQRSIHLSAEAETYIKLNYSHYTDDKPSYSVAVNDSIAMLRWLKKSSVPDDLFDDEWTELYNIYAGSDMARMAIPFDIARDLLDYYGSNIVSRLPSNAQGLYNKLLGYSQAEQFAIKCYVREFWNCADLEAFSEDDNLANAAKKHAAFVGQNEQSE